MASIAKLIRAHRTELGMNQTEFGLLVGLIMTDISKIENNKKKFPFDKLEKLSRALKMDFTELKNIYVAERLVREAHKYNCPDSVFAIAENQSKYVRNKQLKQGKINF